MPLSGDEPVCPKFQPNIFDPSRCHDCLRQKHLHAGAAAETAGAEPQQSPTAETGTGTGTGIGLGLPGKGAPLPPILSQGEERDTSGKEDSDGLSVVSSYCDVSGGRPGYEESSLCILSPDCDLYICDGDDDDSTDSCQDQSDYPELSGSVSAEDDYLPIRRRPTHHHSMTRLDPPPHRPNPRVWMEEARSKDSFGRHSGLKGERESRESGYFSLGRAAGARSLRDKSQPPPYRHIERGHPLFNTRNIEPKDTIPFRNPNLGVASERPTPEDLTEDLPLEIPPPPDPYDIAVEVEAQVGPRSPSPTPFKIAESLAAPGRRGVNTSYGRGNLSSQSSSHQQSGRFDSTRQGSALQSRSSSPLRGNLPFRRSESAASLNRSSYDGGGRSQGRDQKPRSPSQGTYGGLGGESGTLPSNFKSFANSVKPQHSTVSDFRSALRKSEVNGSLNVRGRDSRTSSPSRRDYSQTSLRKTDITSSSSNGRGVDSRTSPPSRRSYDTSRDSQNASPPRRSYNSPSQSLLQKSESITSLNASPPRRSYNSPSQSLLQKSESVTSLNASPPRRSYNSPSQSLLQKSESVTSLNASPPRRSYNSPSQSLLQKSESITSLNASPPRRSYNSPSQSLLQKSESITSLNASPPRRSYNSSSQSLLHKSESVTSLNSRSHRGRPGSPVREGYDFESQALLRNSVARNGLNDDEYENLSPSLSRRGCEAPSQSVLRKSESNSYGGGRGLESRSSSPGRRSHEAPGRSLLRKTDTSGSLNSHGRQSRNSSPSRRSYDTPSHSLLRKSDANSSVKSHSHSHDGRSSPPARKGYEASGQSILRKTESGSLNSRSHNSHSSSPSRKGTSDPPGYSVLKHASSGDSNHSYQRKSMCNDTKSDSNPSRGSWQDSTHSPRSSSVSRGASPLRQTTENSRTSLSQRAPAVTMETTRSSSISRGGSGRRGLETRSPSPDNNRSSLRTQSHSPSSQIQMRRHTSSQSSMDSSESGQLSGGSTGRNREEYAMMADLPKVKMIHQREEPGHMGQPRNHRLAGKQELFKPASHSLSKHPSREWDDRGDSERDSTGWQYGGSGYLSRAHSSTSLHTQRSASPIIEEAGSWRDHHHKSEQMQPDLLNFKKGWMSKLDENGEWKKHWFVLTDAGLRYYRDSGAEEKDDLDGEIDLKSCVKVSEFDVEKNYGFQIQTQEAVFTLSAMTAGIRRNWIEVLRKSVRPSSSPDITHLPDSSSDKENSNSRSLSSRRLPSRHGDTRSEIPTSAPPTHRRFDYVELSPVPAPSKPPPASQREAGEGQGREHSQWQEERSRDATTSQWEAVLSRKGPGFDSRLRMEDEIERKWAEFECIPLKEMRSLPPMGSRSPSQQANEALQREVASLRQQLERLKGGGGGGGGGCGPDASCGRSLSAMERAHRQALEELQKQHERQTRELETERDRLLLEETRATAQVMEALKKAHREELEREVEKARRLSGGVVDSQTARSQQRAETQALQRELSGLSERYSQKCLELNRAEQSNADREREISRKERDMEQLRKENQDLQARLTEEISRMRSVVTGQGSEGVCSKDRDRTSCELEVLLRVKENEVDYLHKEISCLRNEFQFLNTEKRLACERYKEVHEELSGMKGRSEREIQGLKEHLRLAMAALQEGQVLGNSLDH